MPYIKINRKIINVDDYKCPICGDPVDYFTDPGGAPSPSTVPRAGT